MEEGNVEFLLDSISTYLSTHYKATTSTTSLTLKPEYLEVKDQNYPGHTK